jgi:hypothetical protein
MVADCEFAGVVLADGMLAALGLAENAGVMATADNVGTVVVTTTLL